MLIEIKLSQSDLNREIANEVSKQIEKEVAIAIKNIDIEKLIKDTVERIVSRSTIVGDKQLKDFVRQKIARDLTDKVFNKLMD